MIGGAAYANPYAAACTGYPGSAFDTAYQTTTHIPINSAPTSQDQGRNHLKTWLSFDDSLVIYLSETLCLALIFFQNQTHTRCCFHILSKPHLSKLCLHHSTREIGGAQGRRFACIIIIVIRQPQTSRFKILLQFHIILRSWRGKCISYAVFVLVFGQSMRLQGLATVGPIGFCVFKILRRVVWTNLKGAQGDEQCAHTWYCHNTFGTWKQIFERLCTLVQVDTSGCSQTLYSGPMKQSYRP